MSTTTSSTYDGVLPIVPKLDQAGTNWVIFQLRFQIAIRGKGLWGHFDGSCVRPVQSPISTSRPSSPSSPLSSPGSPSASSGSTTYETASASSVSTVTPAVAVGTSREILEWDRQENLARSLLSQRLPNATRMIIDEQPTVADMWKAVVAEYTYKRKISQTQLLRVFLSSRCPKDGDVRVFLNDLSFKHAELTTCGAHIDDDDYIYTIIQSLPYHLSSFASIQFTAAKLAGRDISPDTLIVVICNEWARTASSRSRDKRNNDSGDDPLVVDGGKGRWKGKVRRGRK